MITTLRAEREQEEYKESGRLLSPSQSRAPEWKFEAAVV